MAKARRYGPWKGLNEWPAEAGPEHVEDCCNVEFDGDTIRTRQGRVKLFSGYNVLPARVVFEDNKTIASGLPPVRTDYTREATDRLASTVFNAFIGVGAGAGNTDYLYLGFNSPVRSFYVEIGTGNTVASVLSVSHYASGGWTASTVSSDGTALSGKTLASHGTVTLGASSVTDARSVSLFGERLYWYRLGASATCDGTLSGVYSTLTSAANTLGAVNGVYHWKRQGGESAVVVGFDLLDPPVARLGILDLRSGFIRPMRIGGMWTNNGPDERTGPEAHWRFTTLDRFLIACNGYCLLHSDPDDPDSMMPFAQVNLKAGAVQTNQPPARAKYVAVYGGAIYVVEPHRPNVVRMSNPFGFNRDIDTDRVPKAPLEGANIWDQYAWFTVSDEAGTPITGMATSGSKLLVFTERSTHAWVGNTASGAQAILDPHVGCVAPDSLASTEDAVFFLAGSGVYAHAGGVNKLLSHPIQRTMSELNRYSLTSAVGVAYHKKQQYRLSVSLGNARENDAVLVYNWRVGWWSKFGLWRPLESTFIAYPVVAAFSLQDPEWDDLLIECDYSANVYVADTGAFDDTSAIASLAVFSRVGFDDQGMKTVRGVWFEINTINNAGPTIYIYKNGKDWRSSSSSVGFIGRVDGQSLSGLPDDGASLTGQVFGDNLFGTSVWQAPGYRSRAVSIGGATATIGPTGRYFNILAYAKSTPFDIRGYEANFITREADR